MGAEALKPAMRGKNPGRRHRLSASQERMIQQIICDKRPEQLKMAFALRNRAAVMQLIERECGIKLPVRGVGNYLILENLRAHHSKPVNALVEAHKDTIELFYLPSNSPEINPEERLNADLKQALHTKVPVCTKTKLKAATKELMEALEKSPERVKAFLQDARVKYAV